LFVGRRKVVDKAVAQALSEAHRLFPLPRASLAASLAASVAASATAGTATAAGHGHGHGGVGGGSGAGGDVLEVSVGPSGPASGESASETGAQEGAQRQPWQGTRQDPWWDDMGSALALFRAAGHWPEVAPGADAFSSSSSSSSSSSTLPASARGNGRRVLWGTAAAQRAILRAQSPRQCRPGGPIAAADSSFYPRGGPFNEPSANGSSSVGGSGGVGGGVGGGESDSGGPRFMVAQLGLRMGGHGIGSLLHALASALALVTQPALRTSVYAPRALLAALACHAYDNSRAPGLFFFFNAVPWRARIRIRNNALTRFALSARSLSPADTRQAHSLDRVLLLDPSDGNLFSVDSSVGERHRRAASASPDASAAASFASSSASSASSASSSSFTGESNGQEQATVAAAATEEKEEEAVPFACGQTTSFECFFLPLSPCSLRDALLWPERVPRSGNGSGGGGGDDDENSIDDGVRTTLLRSSRRPLQYAARCRGTPKTHARLSHFFSSPLPCPYSFRYPVRSAVRFRFLSTFPSLCSLSPSPSCVRGGTTSRPAPPSSPPTASCSPRATPIGRSVVY